MKEEKHEIKGEETLVDIGVGIYNEFNGSRRKKRTTSQRDPNLKTKKKKGGYGEIGRRYGLNWIEPWYGNLLSDNFQIQGNPGINKNRQS